MVPCTNAPGLDPERAMQDITFHVGRAGNVDLESPDRTDDAAAHDHLLGKHPSMHRPVLADQHTRCTDVAVDAALDLDIAAGQQVSFDDDVRSDDGEPCTRTTASAVSGPCALLRPSSREHLLPPPKRIERPGPVDGCGTPEIRIARRSSIPAPMVRSSPRPRPNLEGARSAYPCGGGLSLRLGVISPASVDAARDGARTKAIGSLCQLLGGRENLLCVSRDLDVAPDAGNPPFSVDQKGGAFDSHVLAPVHTLLHPYAILGDRVVLRVGCQRHRKAMLGSEPPVTVNAVSRNPDDLGIRRTERLRQGGEVDRLSRAPRRIVLRIEIDDGLPAPKCRQRDGPLVRVESEVRSRLALCRKSRHGAILSSILLCDNRWNRGTAVFGLRFGCKLAASGCEIR